jgi:hypothetical protein
MGHLVAMLITSMTPQSFLHPVSFAGQPGKQSKHKPPLVRQNRTLVILQPIQVGLSATNYSNRQLNNIHFVIFAIQH